MRVLLLGGNGFLGPHVVRALAGRCDLRITDVVPLDSPHETRRVDVADLDQVRAAASGCDAIVNCAVTRVDRRRAFAVNALGTYNAVMAAVELGHERFVNTGPRFTVAGPAYLTWDFGVREEVPPHPGTGLYALSKSLGQEACRIAAEAHPIHVLTLLFSTFCDAAPAPGHDGDMNPFAVTFRDAAQAVRCALEVDLARLPSRCQTFFVTVDLPQDQVRCGKARRLLDWAPQDGLEAWWRAEA